MALGRQNAQVLARPEDRGVHLAVPVPSLLPDGRIDLRQELRPVDVLAA